MAAQEIISFVTALCRDPIEPQTYRQAINGPESNKWKASMQAEYDALIKNQTWDAVLPPANAHILDGKWVYKIKRDEKGEITQYKARWVVKGYEQVYGTDYDQTYAGVAKTATLKAIFAIAAAGDMEIWQMDAVAAFLNGDITQRVYVRFPYGFEQFTTTLLILVCLLNKGLYGLKQSGRLWALKVRTKLAKYGYRHLEADSSIYWNPKIGVYIVTYVDDFLIISPKMADINVARGQLKTEFEMKDLGPCHYFLGIQIIRDRPNRRIHLIQGAYIDKMLATFQMENATGFSTPMEAGAKSLIKDFDGIASKTDVKLYQSMVGSVNYLMTQTRPDLGFAISFLSQFLQNPGPAHINAARRLLKYVKQTKNLGITYYGSKPGFTGHSDADYAEDI